MTIKHDVSAIDFDMSVEKIPDEKGDRVKVRLGGEFLSCKAW